MSELAEELRLPPTRVLVDWRDQDRTRIIRAFGMAMTHQEAEEIAQELLAASLEVHYRPHPEYVAPGPDTKLIYTPLNTKRDGVGQAATVARVSTKESAVERHIREAVRSMEASAEVPCTKCSKPRGMKVRGGMSPGGECTHCGYRYAIPIGRPYVYKSA